MNIYIMDDIAWQLEAHRRGGIAEIQAINDSNPDLLDGNAIAAWLAIDDGVKNGDLEAVWAGNLALLRREQLQTLAQPYAELWSDYYFLSAVMSVLSQNPVWGPVPLDPRPFLFGDFEFCVPFGFLPDSIDRWDWITFPGTGIWPAWKSRIDWDKSFQVRVWLRLRAFTYSYVGIIW